MRRLRGAIALVAIAGASLAALGAGLHFSRGGASPNPTPRASGEPPAPTPSESALRWQPRFVDLPTPKIVRFDLSSSGETIAWLDTRGAVRKLDESGKTLWQTGDGTFWNRILALDTGEIVMFTALNPARTSLRRLKSTDGAPIPLETGGAIWCAATQGDTLLASSGNGVRHRFENTVSPTFALAQAPVGHIEQIVPLKNGTSLESVWMPTGIRLVNPDGSARWSLESPRPARCAKLTVSADGSTVIALFSDGTREANPEVVALDGPTGMVLWRRRIDGDRVRVAVSRSGAHIAISYRVFVARGGETLFEQRLAAHDRAGNSLFSERGGRFFSPTLIGFMDGGDRLTVCDGDRALITLGITGKMLGRTQLPPNKKTGQLPTIVAARASADGREILLWRGDDTLSFYQAVDSTKAAP